MANNIRILTLSAMVLVVASAAVAATNPGEAINSALVRSGADVRGIVVIQIEDIIILRGTVPTRADLDSVRTAVDSCKGCRIANLVGIAARPDDEAIERRVERALALAPSLEGCKFALVQSQSGAVRIEGTVRREIQKDVARSIVREVEGVREVVAQLNRV
ncbi:MAG: BON domain-containing protein [Thermoanaerobaculia bacterium]